MAIEVEFLSMALRYGTYCTFMGENQFLSLKGLSVQIRVVMVRNAWVKEQELISTYFLNFLYDFFLFKNLNWYLGI
jgi:hypothetical protein